MTHQEGRRVRRGRQRREEGVLKGTVLSPLPSNLLQEQLSFIQVERTRLLWHWRAQKPSQLVSRMLFRTASIPIEQTVKRNYVRLLLFWNLNHRWRTECNDIQPTLACFWIPFTKRTTIIWGRRDFFSWPPKSRETCSFVNYSRLLGIFPTLIGA